MSFKNLTVEQVRGELAKLIANYPDRKGGIDIGGGPDQLSCVYYVDEEGKAVTGVDEYEGQDIFSLVTPVCIIGEWVESFHPELKRDENFQLVLLRNSLIGNSDTAAEVLGEEIRNLLAWAQTQQDDGLVWEQIKL